MSKAIGRNRDVLERVRALPGVSLPIAWESPFIQVKPGPRYLFRATIRLADGTATWRGPGHDVSEARAELEHEWGNWGDLVWFFGTEPFRQ